MSAFLDLPIEGDIDHGYKRTAQEPRELLERAIVNALAFPQLEAFRWVQYTPYFNDGDPCFFNVRGIYFKFARNHASDDVDYDEEDYDEYGERGGFCSEWSTDFYETVGEVNWSTVDDRWTNTGHTAPNGEEFYEAIHELKKRIDGGAHDDVLLELFGDHAEITCDGTKFEVEFYEHD